MWVFNWMSSVLISPFARWAFPPLLGEKLKPADIPVIQRKVHWLSSPMTGRIKVGMLYFDLFTINHIHSIYIPICPSDIFPTIGGKIETGGHPRHSTKSTLAFLPDDGED